MFEEGTATTVETMLSILPSVASTTNGDCELSGEGEGGGGEARTEEWGDLLGTSMDVYPGPLTLLLTPPILRPPTPLEERGDCPGTIIPWDMVLSFCMGGSGR